MSPIVAATLRMFVGGLTAALLAGCANLTGYEKAAVTPEEFKRDVTQCKQRAEVYDRGIIPPLFPDPDIKARVLHDRKAYRECMLSRGYKETGWRPF
jgi:hypothetical protein